MGRNAVEVQMEKVHSVWIRVFVDDRGSRGSDLTLESKALADATANDRFTCTERSVKRKDRTLGKGLCKVFCPLQGFCFGVGLDF